MSDLLSNAYCSELVFDSPFDDLDSVKKRAKHPISAESGLQVLFLKAGGIDQAKQGIEAAIAQVCPRSHLSLNVL